jgi:hypothetical protein
MMIHVQWRSDEMLSARAIVEQQVETGHEKKQRPMPMLSFELPTVQVRLG